MVFQLTDEIGFPDPKLGDPDGLLAVGGDLSVDRLLLAYSYGIFPWYAFRDGMIQWWCPMDRFVIFPSEIHISHSMRNLMNKGCYRVSFNEAFEEVIRHCGELRMQEEGAWLGPEMMEAYTRMRRSVGRRPTGGWSLRGVHRKMFLWREHVFPGPECFQAGTHPVGSVSRQPRGHIN